MIIITTMQWKCLYHSDAFYMQPKNQSTVFGEVTFLHLLLYLYNLNSNFFNISTLPLNENFGTGIFHGALTGYRMIDWTTKDPVHATRTEQYHSTFQFCIYSSSLIEDASEIFEVE